MNKVIQCSVFWECTVERGTFIVHVEASAQSEAWGVRVWGVAVRSLQLVALRALRLGIEGLHHVLHSLVCQTFNT
jgi:hypothetical protein